MFEVIFLYLFSQGTIDIDFSRAGRDRPLTAHRFQVNVESFGAIPNDGIDDSMAFNAALDSVQTTGGTVFVPKGVWTIEHVVHLHSNQTHLMGDTSGGTILSIPKTLAEVYGENPNWSWSGGFIKVAPKSKGRRLGSVQSRFNEGDTRLTVDWDSKPDVGEWVQLWWYNDVGEDSLLKWLYGEPVHPTRFGKEIQQSTSKRVASWFKVVDIENNELTLNPPLPLPIEDTWNVEVRGLPYVLGSSVKHLSFDFEFYPYPGHLNEKGNNAIQLSSAVQCEVANISIQNGDSGIFLGNCGFTTVKDIEIKGRTMHHPISLSWCSHCLVEEFVIDAPHIHGTTISWASHFNVFRNGRGTDLAMDAHRGYPFRNLHERIKIVCTDNPKQPLRSGGKWERGLHSARENAYVDIEFIFKSQGQPFTIALLNEWPMGYFSNWRGNREIVMKQGFPGQQIIELGKKPSLHE